MSWVRIHPYLTNWPDGCPPPVFTISAAGPGTAVVELAWDPQALAAPADYDPPLRYYCSAIPEVVDGATVAAQSISLTGSTVDWVIPAPLWAAYVAEAAKVGQAAPSSTNFSGNLYYRVRVTPTGAGQADVWPSDDVLNSAGAAAAPHLGILTSSTTNAAPVPDQAALAAAGGPPAAPTQWRDIVGWCWSHLPDMDDYRKALAEVFAHPAFRGADPATRGRLLALWVLAGPASRLRVADLLDLTTTGGAADVPAWSTHSRSGETLLDGLIALIDVAPHPELTSVIAKEQLVDDVLTEILDPNGQSDLAEAGTCAATCPQAWLIGVNPAEYARLQRGLLAVSGATALADGSALTVPAGAFLAVPEATPLGRNVFVARTYAEIAFSSALLARVAPFPADPTAAAANAALQSAVQTGFDIEQAAAMLTALFGAAVTPRNVSWPPRPDDAGWQAEQDAVRDSLLEALSQRRSAMVHLFWWQAPSGPNAVTHPVLALQHDAGSVVVRNSQYAGSVPPSFAVAGGTADLPPRSYRDPTRALESLTDNDCAAWILGYLVPTTALS